MADGFWRSFYRCGGAGLDSNFVQKSANRVTRRQTLNWRRYSDTEACRRVIAPSAGPAFSTRFHASRASPSSGDIRASRDAIATSLGAAGGFDHLEPSVG